MSFVRGDTCYILENNMNTRAAKVINKQGRFYIIQLVGSCGAIRLLESRLFETEEDAQRSRKVDKKIEAEIKEDNCGFVDVFGGHRKWKSPH